MCLYDRPVLLRGGDNYVVSALFLDQCQLVAVNGGQHAVEFLLSRRVCPCDREGDLSDLVYNSPAD
jgi:hypothetical protein